MVFNGLTYTYKRKIILLVPHIFLKVAGETRSPHSFPRHHTLISRKQPLDCLFMSSGHVAMAMNFHWWMQNIIFCAEFHFLSYYSLIYRKSFWVQSLICEHYLLSDDICFVSWWLVLWFPNLANLWNFSIKSYSIELCILST